MRAPGESRNSQGGLLGGEGAWSGPWRKGRFERKEWSMTIRKMAERAAGVKSGKGRADCQTEGLEHMPLHDQLSNPEPFAMLKIQLLEEKEGLLFSFCQLLGCKYSLHNWFQRWLSLTTGSQIFWKCSYWFLKVTPAHHCLGPSLSTRVLLS